MRFESWSRSSRRAAPAALLLVGLLPAPVLADQVDVYVTDVHAPGGVDAEMTALLYKAVVKHAGAGWSVKAGKGCGPGRTCATVHTLEKEGTYEVSLAAGNGDLLATSSVEPPPGAPAGDVADAIAIKIVFLMEKFRVPIEEKKGGAPPAPETKPKHVTGPAPEEPAPGWAALEPGEPEEPPAEPVVVIEEGAGGEPAAGIALADVGEEPEAEAPKPPAVRYRLTIDGAYTTGFSADFNTGGIEPGLLLVFRDVVGLRIDVGVHGGGAKRKALCLEAFALPVSILGGYRLERDSVSFGVLAGVSMLSLWLEYHAQVCGRAWDMRIGAAALVEIEMRLGGNVSVGLFIRPAVFADKVRIRRGGSKLVELSYVMLTTGLSLVFDLGPGGEE